MKKLLYYAVLIIMMIVCAASCSKEPTPEPIEPETGLTVTTDVVIIVTETTADGGGSVTAKSEPAIACGICWDTITEPTIKGNKTVDNLVNGKFSSHLADLISGETYYVRAYATNKYGTTYGSSIYLQTKQTVGSYITLDATTIAIFSATLNGIVDPNNLETSVFFEYGLTSAYENTVAATPNIINGSNNVPVSVVVSNLNPGVKYYFRLKAVNSTKTIYGSEKSFTTLGAKPNAENRGMSAGNSNNDAKLNALVNSNLLETVVSFQYGLTAAYGNEIVVGTIPGGRNNDTIINTIISNLELITTYHFRVKAVNVLGTTYSSDTTFLLPLLVTDIDGNVYHALVIGGQTWLMENLKTTHYRNGDEIANVTDGTAWGELTTGAMCWYNNNYSTFGTVYGGLYNFYAATDPRGLAIEGWHVPTDEEFTTLKAYLGGNSGNVGGKLKETGYTHWLQPNLGATNATNFTALPGGFRGATGPSGPRGIFGAIKEVAYFWSATTSPDGNAWVKFICFDSSSFFNDQSSYKFAGFSIRLVKD